MNRKKFIEAGVSILIVIGASCLVACNNTSTTAPGPDPTPAPTATPVQGDITVTSASVNEHAHTVTMPAADLTSATSKTYTSSSVLGHNHMVTLTGDQIAAIRNGQSVTVTSTGAINLHTHQFTFRK